MLAGASIDEDWYRIGAQLSRVSDTAGPRRRDFSKLVESPELRQVLAEVAAVRRRVRARSTYRSSPSPGTTRPAKPLRCTTSRSIISQDANADHALLIGPFDSRSVEHGASSSVRELRLDAVARIDPNEARYDWFEHALARGRAAGHLERQRQLRARRRERMAPRAVTHGTRKPSHCAST